MPRRVNKGGRGRPGRNMSARARNEREQRRRSESSEAAQEDRLERRRRPVEAPKVPPIVVCPGGKTGYRTKELALERLAAYGQGDRPSRPTRPVRVYRCPMCGAWHLTSSDRRTISAPSAPFDASRPAIPPPSPRFRPPRPSSPPGSS